nr:external alternative NAD(P)H-ubiquinone oxidoreductase B2, mitochondrial-like [Ipomoea batatas]
MLHFVIVGGGPTGVEFAAQLHDFVSDEVVRLYPKAKDFVKITLVEATDHVFSFLIFFPNLTSIFTTGLTKESQLLLKRSSREMELM